MNTDRAPLVIIYAICLHLIWAVLLIGDHAVKKITAVAAFTVYVYYPWGAIAFWLVAVLAIVGLLTPGRWGVVLMLPQQCMLFLSAGGALAAMWAAHFPDGYVASRAFIAADQSPAVLIAILHTWAIVQQMRIR